MHHCVVTATQHSTPTTLAAHDVWLTNWPISRAEYASKHSLRLSQQMPEVCQGRTFKMSTADTAAKLYNSPYAGTTARMKPKLCTNSMPSCYKPRQQCTCMCVQCTAAQTAKPALHPRRCCCSYELAASTQLCSAQSCANTCARLRSKSPALCRHVQLPSID